MVMIQMHDPSGICNGNVSKLECQQSHNNYYSASKFALTVPLPIPVICNESFAFSTVLEWDSLPLFAGLPC